MRPIDPDNPYRRLHAARFMVGLSGNMGFTHDPDVVFEAARRLSDARRFIFCSRAGESVSNG
jgi:colanic acid biosynthesis glycosyl transferase WcaI